MAERHTTNKHPCGTFSRFRPRGVEHDWDLRTYKVGDMKLKADSVIAELTKLYDRVGRAERLTFSTIVKPLLEAHRYYVQMGSFVTLPRHVAESPELRQSSAEATKLLDNFYIEMSMRKDVFDKLVEYEARHLPNENISPEYKRCIDKLISLGRRNSLHLDKETRSRIKCVKKRLNELTIAFSKNINDDKTTISLDQHELTGLPLLYFKDLALNPQTKQYDIKITPENVLPISRKCLNPGVRKKVESLYYSRCIDVNSKLLKEILELRQTEATLLGYTNHASFVQEILMAKTPETVHTFLTDLILVMKLLWEDEKHIMLNLKREESELYHFENESNTLESYDFLYYGCRLEEMIYGVKQEVLMEYFPLTIVILRMMEMFGDFFGLRYHYLSHAAKWNDDVLVYQLDDSSSDEVLGYIYLDLYARDGKFGQACCIPIQPGCLGQVGIRQIAVSVMLTNFTKSQDSRPTLLDHKDVETCFHEFGHLTHFICGRAKTSMLFGTRVESDFVETPSQLLENWVWEKGPLKRISSHYLTGKCLPDDMIERLISSRGAVAGGRTLRQIVLALVDQHLHTHVNCDSKVAYASILWDVMGIKALPETNACATFSHLCFGYSARYYSYLWSEVFSADIFEHMVEKHGLRNSVGRKYRREVLQHGGAQDASDMLRNFLGREPNDIAFLCRKVRDGVTPEFKDALFESWRQECLGFVKNRASSDRSTSSRT